MAKRKSREEAWAPTHGVQQRPFHLKHGETVEGVMRWSRKSDARLGA